MRDTKLSLPYTFLHHRWLQNTKGHIPSNIESAKLESDHIHPKEWRTVTGHGNCPFHANAGARGQCFGHSYDIKDPPKSLDAYGLNDPEVKLISKEFLARADGSAKITTQVNSFCSAWIQFMVHDWMEHELDKDKYLCDGVMATRIEYTDLDTGTPYYANQNSHWWQGTQIYGRTSEQQHSLRTHTHGHIKVSPSDPAAPNMDLVGSGSPNLWFGLTLLHVLFSMEHNSICDMLEKKHSGWNDERLYQTAKLINTASIAKIHVLEWTKAILNHPVAHSGQNSLWGGLAPAWFPRWCCCIPFKDKLFGKAGMPKIQHGNASFAHTEEFSAVYRMHSLLLDEYIIFNDIGDELERLPLEKCSFENTRGVTERHSMESLVYSMGCNGVGLLEPQNYPKMLSADGRIDLGAIDVLRERERRVPRFNDFRRIFRLPAYKSIDDLASHHGPMIVDRLKSVYGGDVEKVDTLIGCLMEKKTKGFLFSHTVYTLFMHQTQRRIECDRFLTKDFKASLYTKEGLAWVKNVSLKSVIQRHTDIGRTEIPENAFMTWREISTHDKSSALTTPLI